MLVLEVSMATQSQQLSIAISRNTAPVSGPVTGWLISIRIQMRSGYLQVRINLSLMKCLMVPFLLRWRAIPTLNSIFRSWMFLLLKQKFSVSKKSSNFWRSIGFIHGLLQFEDGEDGKWCSARYGKKMRLPSLDKTCLLLGWNRVQSSLWPWWKWEPNIA